MTAGAYQPRGLFETPPPLLRGAGVLLLFAGQVLINAPAAAAEDVEARLKAVAAAVCTAPDGDAITLARALGGAVRLDVKPMEVRGQAVGSRARFMLKDGAWVYVERFAPGGVLRRLTIVYHAPPERARRPERMVIANGDCRIVSGRRLGAPSRAHISQKYGPWQTPFYASCVGKGSRIVFLASDKRSGQSSV